MDLVQQYSQVLLRFGIHEKESRWREVLAIELLNYLRSSFFSLLGTQAHQQAELTLQILLHHKIDDALHFIFAELPPESKSLVGKAVHNTPDDSIPNIAHLAHKINWILLNASTVQDGKLLSGTQVMGLLKSAPAENFLANCAGSWSDGSKDDILSRIGTYQTFVETKITAQFEFPDPENPDNLYGLQVGGVLDLLMVNEIGQSIIFDHKRTPHTSANRGTADKCVCFLYQAMVLHRLMAGRTLGEISFPRAVEVNGHTLLRRTPLIYPPSSLVAMYEVPFIPRQGEPLVFPQELSIEDHNQVIASLAWIAKLATHKPELVRRLTHFDSGYHHPQLTTESSKLTAWETFDQLEPFREA